MSRKVVLYIACSLDGYIAKPGDDLGFLSLVHKEGEDYGYADFMATVDTVLMGRKTYEWVINQVDYPHADKISYIITRTPRPSHGNVHFYTGNIKDLVLKLKSEPGGVIFCDGGAEIANMLLSEGLIDEFIISVVPILVGEGIRLFKDGRPELPLQLIAATSFDTGLVQMHYKRTSP